jgi:hypothetical protein
VDVARLLSGQRVARAKVAGLVVSHLKEKDAELKENNAELAELKAKAEDEAAFYVEVAKDYLQMNTILDARWLMGAGLPSFAPTQSF